MATLSFQRISRQDEINDFDCGIPSIDEYVKNSYFPHISQQAYAYSIRGNGCVLGFYQILFREIELDRFPEDISEFDSGIKDEKITSLHIRYIAIDSKYQKNKTGTFTLRTIIKNVIDFSDSWPIRVITIDAKTDLVNWYEEEGFKVMKKNTEGQDGTTVAMYFDCMKFQDELEEYISEMV